MQFFQLGRGVRQGLLRLLLRGLRPLLLLHQLIVAGKPLIIFLEFLLLCQQLRFFVSKYLQTLLKLL